MGRLQGAEAALEGKTLAAGTLVAALRAARRDLGADAHPLIAQLAEGMLLNLLAPLVPKVGTIVPSCTMLAVYARNEHVAECGGVVPSAGDMFMAVNHSVLQHCAAKERRQVPVCSVAPVGKPVWRVQCCTSICAERVKLLRIPSFSPVLTSTDGGIVHMDSCEIPFSARLRMGHQAFCQADTRAALAILLATSR